MLGLDAAKRPVDTATSNVGHLLWSGILDKALAGRPRRYWPRRSCPPGGDSRDVERRPRYNPIEYHNGTVWPHDTAIVAEGLRRYGYRQQAAALAVNLFEAAAAFGLPASRSVRRVPRASRAASPSHTRAPSRPQASGPPVRYCSPCVPARPRHKQPGT